MSWIAYQTWIIARNPIPAQASGSPSTIERIVDIQWKVSSVVRLLAVAGMRDRLAVCQFGLAKKAMLAACGGPSRPPVPDVQGARAGAAAPMAHRWTRTKAAGGAAGGRVGFDV
jgi:hypothetical protein